MVYNLLDCKSTNVVYHISELLLSLFCWLLKEYCHKSKTYIYYQWFCLPHKKSFLFIKSLSYCSLNSYFYKQTTWSTLQQVSYHCLVLWNRRISHCEKAAWDPERRHVPVILLHTLTTPDHKPNTRSPCSMATLWKATGNRKKEQSTHYGKSARC